MDAKALLFSLAIIFSPLIVFLISNNRRKACNPPGPFSWPIVGNLFQIDPKKPHISLAKLAESYGPVMTIKLGSRHIIVASSPAAAKEIYKTHDGDLTGRYVPQMAQYSPDFQTSAIAVSDKCTKNWRLLRGILHSSLFTSKALESHSEIRLEKTRDMLGFFKSRNGEKVNFTDVIYATIVNTWTRLFVSEEIIKSWEEVGEIRDITRKLVEFAIPGLFDLFPALSCLSFFGKKKIDDSLEASRKIWGEIIQKRRDEKKQMGDYLDVLINNSFNDNQICNHFNELLSTAETVTIAVEWAMAELVKNQDSFATLRKELEKAVDEGGVLQERQLSKLPYLQAVIKEALRLHPPTPLFLPRSAIQSCQVMNYEIPKDCLVLVNFYTLATDPTFWEDPLSFKPERFMGNNNLDVKGTNYQVLPFGAGRRICSGIPLAIQEMQLLIAAAVLGFNWSLPCGKDPSQLDMAEYFGTTLGLENPLQLIPNTKYEFKMEGY